MNELAHEDLQGTTTRRIAGGVLLASSILVVVAMGHHPSGHEAPSEGLGMTLGGFVHAAMIVLLSGNLWALSVYTLRSPLNGWALGALLAYGVGFAGHLVAGMINGFVVPALAVEVGPGANPEIFQLLWVGNQVAAQLGIYASSVAFLCWSVLLIRSHGRMARVLGTLGFLAAVGPAMALYSGAIHLDVSGAFLAYGAHSLWTGLLGIHVLRSARHPSVEFEP